jgi:cytochrome c-type biogenesis protein CcmH/NrfG
VGAGAGAYEVARTRYRRGTQSIRHAHGYGVQTLADLGLVGLGVSLLGALAWIVAATGATGLRRRDRGLPYDPERIGLLTMSTVVLVFAFHSLIDWTWFVPGTVAVALLCAGWVAGRGPLRARLEGSEEPAVATRWWRPDPATAVAALAVVVLALTICWTALQPVRAAHAEDRSADLASEGKLGPAAAEARQAADRNPLSVDPLFELAFIQDAQGKRQDALATLEAAVHLQPDNSETWRRLGRYRLSVLNDPKGALRAFRAAYFLDPQSARGPSDYLEAARAARGQP